jgi:hypothetical protein
MARFTVSVQPLHHGSPCQHPGGACPRPPTSYRVQCSQHGAVGGPYGLRLFAARAQTDHLKAHREIPPPPADNAPRS